MREPSTARDICSQRGQGELARWTRANSGFTQTFGFCMAGAPKLERSRQVPEQHLSVAGCESRRGNGIAAEMLLLAGRCN